MIISNRVPRRGVTLIEMVAVITVFAVLLGLCAITIQLLMRVGSDAQTRRTAGAALGRLAEQFREDIHASDDVQLRPAAGLRLNRGPGVVIDYQTRDGRVDRVESVNGQASRHESYALDRHDSITFERRDDGPRRFLAMVVRHKVGSGQPDPPHPMEILALVGKDRNGLLASKGGPPR
jgi:prepilin-type N-terminal cleavage/methylation domain-containing protein